MMVPAYVDKDMSPRPFLRVATFCCMGWGWLHLLAKYLRCILWRSFAKIVGEMSWENWAPSRKVLGEIS
jgi:hypothetical protein